jgi:predicted GNAT family acetyltransferase
MDNVQLKLNENKQGAFVIMEEAEQMGEMVVQIAGDTLTVYHTEVSANAEGKGYAKQLLKAMVDYARQNKFSVIPLCPFVHAQFKRHPADYADLWQRPQEG